jgi:hypothetical protein
VKGFALRNDAASDEFALERIKQAGWHLWLVAKKENRVFAASRVADLVKQIETKG